MSETRYARASFGKRFLAHLLDNIFTTIVIFIIAGDKIITTPASGQVTTPDELAALYQDMMANQFTLTLYSLIITLAYYVVIAYFLKGATIGKLIMKIKIQTLYGQNPTFMKLFVREVLIKNLLASVTCGIINIISAFKVANGNLSIHDSLVNTDVVDTRVVIGEYKD